MAKPKKPTRMQQFLEGLHCSNIDSEVQHIDWSEELGPDQEGWRAVEVQQCDECKRWVSSDGYLGETRHCDLDSETECDGYFNFDGPMMNYFYPCDFGRGGTDAAAEAIKHTACVAVEVNGNQGFALAGGGMDLSWDIAAAYVACGQLPPAWIRPPRMAGYSLTAQRRRIIAACMQTQEVMIHRSRNNMRDLKHLKKCLAEQTRENRKRKREQAAQPAAH